MSTALGGARRRGGIGTPSLWENVQTYGGQMQISPNVGPGGGPTASLTDSQIVSNPQSAISASPLPAPTGTGLSDLYIVILPAGDTMCAPGTSCTPVWGYHSSVNQSGYLLDLVITDIPSNSPVCGSSSDAAQTAASTDVLLSGQMENAITDPLVGQASSVPFPVAWYSNTGSAYSDGGEVATPCVGQTAQQAVGGDTFTVQEFWSVAQTACVSSETFNSNIATFTSSAFWESARPGVAVSATRSARTGPDARNHAKAAAAVVSCRRLTLCRRYQRGAGGFAWTRQSRQRGMPVMLGRPTAAPGTHITVMFADERRRLEGHLRPDDPN